jgi:hypothetical protein
MPLGGLVFDSIGNLYGAANVGGSASHGTVFKLSHVPGSPWVLSSLYSFCTLAQCADGLEPSGNLLLDSAGNVYGTTLGGAKGGVVFKITP